MVLPDSHGIPRAPCYSGTHPTPRPRISPTGLSPSTVPFPTGFGYPQRQCSRPADPDRHAPQPHTRNPCRVSHAHGLASSPFAHHYSGNHSCFLLLRVLRCFTSPRSHQLPYTFRQRRRAITHARFPHSDTHGSTLGWQLPVAYRGLPRPSSAPGAKASTVCHTRLATTETRRSHTLSTNQNPRHTPNQHTPHGMRQPGWPEQPPHTHTHNDDPPPPATAQHLNPPAREPHNQPTDQPPANQPQSPQATSGLSTEQRPRVRCLRDTVVPSDTQQRAPTHHQRQAGKRLPLNPPGHPPTHAPHTMQHTTGGVHFRASRPTTHQTHHVPRTNPASSSLERR